MDEHHGSGRSSAAFTGFAARTVACSDRLRLGRLPIVDRDGVSR